MQVSETHVFNYLGDVAELTRPMGSMEVKMRFCQLVREPLIFR